MSATGVRRRSARAGTGMAVATLALVGCAGEGPPEPGPTTATTATATPAPSDPGAAVEIPEDRAGQAARWVLDQLAAESGPSAEEAAARFAEAFLAQVPAADVAAVFDQMRALGPFVATGYAGTEDAGQLELVGADDQRFVAHVATVADGRMEGLFLQAATAVPDVASLEDLDGALAALDAQTSALVARVGEDGTCTPLHERDAGELRPIGSAFKLYVLGAVVGAVEDGTLAWEDPLTLTDDLRSLPSGVLQDEPAGTEVSVLDAARGMIAISDNTATDLLIDAVGRDAVETALGDLGHSAPEVMSPLLTTREMFQVAFTDPVLRRQWEDAGADPAAARPAREAILETLPGGAVTLDEALMAQPAWPAGLDWFATARDLCAAHAGLDALAGTAAGEPVREVLSANPGAEVAAPWEHVAFKGGSAPGEMTGSWFAVDDDGDRYAVVIQVAADQVADVPDAGWLTGTATQVLELLGKEEDR
ncbi:Cpe/LpqF family protein [Georgenia wangjunii]|uniref:Cpe/LpqF family protein n=1 Tax=Georgenia wangjunii TaxID=3117730 RepID=UPI002F26C972